LLSDTPGAWKIAASTPTARGVLFELPHAVADVAGLASDRLRLQGGDFFKDPLAACGRQRSQKEYASLVERAGFQFEREIGAGGVSILESLVA
jgi:hypothetical protein